MPLHDWTQVSAGTYHGLHSAWIVEIARLLNNWLLPSSYYAESEQVAGETGPDVLALEFDSGTESDTRVVDMESGGATSIIETRPQVTITQRASEAEVYAQRQNRLAIRHSSGDRLVAYIELLSSGNKSSRQPLDRFLDKAVSVIERGIHLLVVDPFPPGSIDAQGIHGAIWNEINPSDPFQFPDDRHMTAASYHAVRPPVAYIEPVAVGLSLPTMPLFLDMQRYVSLPLEAPYLAAFDTIPRRYRTLLSNSL